MCHETFIAQVLVLEFMHTSREVYLHQDTVGIGSVV
jgi:hypothetical protein